MNDVQMHAMSLERHHRILARAAQQPAPNAGETFAAALESGPAIAQIQPTAAPAEMTAAAEAPRTLATTSPTDTAAIPQLSADQAALLAASLGTELPDELQPATPIAPATATAAAPDLSDDQMALLMASFGQPVEATAPGAAPSLSGPQPEAAPQTAAAMAATAIPQAQDENLRFFPIRQAQDAPAPAARMSASDTYLRAMQQMERNLGAYGGLTGHGR